MKLVVGFSGLKRSGKTTAAEYMVVHSGFIRMSFAQPIKDMLKVLGVSENNPKEKPHLLLHGKTPRYALQTLGTEWGRNMIGGNIWVDVVKNNILNGNAEDNIVIDDCRFKNEVDMILGLGGIIVYIERGGKSGDHASEREVKSLYRSITVENNSSLEDLQEAIMAVKVTYLPE